MQYLPGFILLEVLLAFFVLTLGIFTVSHLFLQALQYERQAYYLNVANLQASMLVEQWQKHACHFDAYINLDRWQASIQQQLPQGSGDLIQDASGCSILISWFDPQGYPCSDGPQAYSCIQLSLGSF